MYFNHGLPQTGVYHHRRQHRHVNAIPATSEGEGALPLAALEPQ